MSTNLDSQLQAAEQTWLNNWKRGPTRIRWTKLPLQVGDAAPDVPVLDSTGKTVQLHDFWRDGPAVLLFWRHYGCSCGMERAKRLQTEYADHLQLGATVVVIGQAEPERSAAYAQQHQLPCPVVCDPAGRVYKAYDVLEGKPSQIVFGAPDAFLQCDYQAGVNLQQSRRGTQRAVVDNPWQLPAEFVVDRSGAIRLAYRYQYCEDWPNPMVLIAAIKEAVWECT